MEEASEEERLAVLYSLKVLDTAPSESFDRLTSILCRVLDMPAALVCLADEKRHWFMSNTGLPGATETPRNGGFCDHAIRPDSPEVLVVHDTLKDPRFKDCPLVTGPPYTRFYAGAPFMLKDGDKVCRLGTACVIDQKPRAVFSVKDKQLLIDVASIVADEIELVRGISAANSARINEEQQRYITCTAHDLRTPLTVFKLATTMFKDYFKERKATREVRARKAAEEGAKHAAAAAAAYADPRIIARRSRENDLVEALEQADVAVDMMEETVCNAIDSARARWVNKRQTEAGAGDSDGGGLLSSSEGGGGTVSSPSSLEQTLLPLVNVQKLVDSCQQLHNRHHGEEVSVTVDVDQEVPSEVSCDGPVLKRVLVNLITNAFKHATPAAATSVSAVATPAASTAAAAAPLSHHHPVSPTHGPPALPTVSAINSSSSSSISSSSSPPRKDTFLGCEAAAADATPSTSADDPAEPPPPVPRPSSRAIPFAQPLSVSAPKHAQPYNSSPSSSSSSAQWSSSLSDIDMSPRSPLSPPSLFNQQREGSSSLGRRQQQQQQQQQQPGASTDPSSLAAAAAAPGGGRLRDTLSSNSSLERIGSLKDSISSTQTSMDMSTSSEHNTHRYSAQVTRAPLLLPTEASFSSSFSSGLHILPQALSHLSVSSPPPPPPSASFSSSSSASSAETGRVLIRARIVESSSSNETAAATVSANLQGSSASLDDQQPTSPPLRRWLRVEVHDNGQGVSSKLQTQLFAEAFVGTHRPSSAQQRQQREQSSDAGNYSEGGGFGGGGVNTANSFVSRQGSGLGLFVVNVCAQDLQGACGFNCSNGSHGIGRTRDGRPMQTGAPMSEPSLGGAVFWFDVPLVGGGGDGGGGNDQQDSSFDNSHNLGSMDRKDSYNHLGSIGRSGSYNNLAGMDYDAMDRSMDRSVDLAEAAVEGGGDLLDLFSEMLGQGSIRTRRNRDRTHGSSSTFGSGVSSKIFTSQTTTNTTSGSEALIESTSTDPCAFETMGKGQVFRGEGGEAVLVGGGGGSSEGGVGGIWPEEEDQIKAGRVLVVDDSVMVQKLLVAALTRQKFEVETAKNGREALEKMTKGSEPYLVVLMDFLMPVLDGITATSMFRTWESTVLLRQGTDKSGDGGDSGGEGASSSSSGAAAEEDNAPSETATTSDSSSGGGSSGSNTDDTDASALPSLVRLKRQTVIGISANAESADVEAAKRAGVDHFLSKPVKVAQIVEYIRAIK